MYLQRGRHEDELEVGAARGDQVPQDDEEEVGVAVALVHLSVCVCVVFLGGGVKSVSAFDQ
jgi:hypothetical protein